ncbi:MAG: GNAT family N-acetyltransferase [Anaerolineae bacterium]|nr:GNAT family N-acetyltransferase [Anaerolineae bacterium]MDW8298593.1 GNAT family N-acetyltransferase [Anaerolineae bacterium]
MNRTVELIPYRPEYLAQAAQVIREMLTTPPLSETVSLNDIIAQLDADQKREEFGGLVALDEHEQVLGGMWWFGLDGAALYERWKPRFAPREAIPVPNGRGVYIASIGVIPSVRNRGLGKYMLNAALSTLEPEHDWIATTAYQVLSAGLAVLRSQGFELLPLQSTQGQGKVALLKYVA